MSQEKKLLMCRGAGLIAVIAVTAASSVWGTELPVLNVLTAGVCWFVGKMIGVPTESVTKLAMQLMQPHKATQIAVNTLRSLPADAAADASHELISSIPPESRARVVELLNASSKPPADDTSPRIAMQLPAVPRVPGPIPAGPQPPPPTGASPTKPTGEHDGG